MRSKAPSWSMTSRKFYSHEEKTPGPGAYSMGTTLSGPNFRMGTSLRISTEKKMSNPGPGAYSPTKPLPFRGSIFMPTSNRKGIVKPGNIPGPGAYNLSLTKEGPAYSLTGRTKTSQQDLNPGPGKYNPNYDATIDKQPAFKLGTSKRITDLSINHSPGPALYDPHLGSTMPSINFGKSNRSISFENNLPGPGKYEPKPTSEGLAFSMTPRRTPILKILTPGPGTYSSSIKSSVPNYSLSKSERKGPADKDSNPGPGAYSPGMPNFGQAPRETIAKAKNTPGPGNYNPVVPETKLSFSLGSRHVEKQKEQTPGPGKYNPNAFVVLESAPSPKIGKSTKGFASDLEKLTKDLPGPGTYLSNSTLSGPKWGFGSSNRS